MQQGRVDFIAPADYSENGKLEQTVFAVLDLIRAQNIAWEKNFKDILEAKE